MIIRFLFIFTFCFFYFANSFANERDNQLDKLFKKLKIDNISISSEIEEKIWKLWSEHPTDQNLTLKLKQGSKLVRENQLLKAVNIFNQVIELDPSWAEAWNKRATVLYMLGDFKGSQNDIDKVLSLENRHFGALAGQGLVNIKLKNYEKAIKSYKDALKIYPSMKSPEIMIKKIENLIKEELI